MAFNKRKWRKYFGWCSLVWACCDFSSRQFCCLWKNSMLNLFLSIFLVSSKLIILVFSSVKSNGLSATPDWFVHCIAVRYNLWFVRQNHPRNRTLHALVVSSTSSLLRLVKGFYCYLPVCCRYRNCLSLVSRQRPARRTYNQLFWSRHRLHQRHKYHLVAWCSSWLSGGLLSMSLRPLCLFFLFIFPA